MNENKNKGKVLLRTRTWHSPYADTPPSISFLVVRSRRTPKAKTPRPEYICSLGTINGWIADPNADLDAYGPRYNYKEHRWLWRVKLGTRNQQLLRFKEKAISKLDMQVAAGKITIDEKQKLVELMDAKMPQ